MDQLESELGMVWA